MKNKKTIITITTTIITALLITTIYTTITSPNSQAQLTLPQSTAPQWQITVTGDFKEQKTWTLTEITQMPLTDVTLENETYLGVSLYDFCNRTGISWDAGNLTIVSKSGKTAMLNIFQAYNSTSYPLNQANNRIVLAFAKNGEWLTTESGGPVQLITPYFNADYQVEQILEVHSEPWNLVVSGKVAENLVINGRNLASYHQNTLRGDFRPGNEPNRTSDWTGIPLFELLETAGAADTVTQVTVVGVDGYTKNFTLSQVKDGKMMIGYQENSQPLPVSQGGPFRLFAPTDTYKWGVNWVKYVTEIIIS